MFIKKRRVPPNPPRLLVKTPSVTPQDLSSSTHFHRHSSLTLSYLLLIMESNPSSSSLSPPTSIPTPRSRMQCIGSDTARCGYCRSRATSRNFGVWAHRLDVRDYQQMLDAGWRRSGKYLYRPDLALTCCPTYVIRLNANAFKPSSTHLRVLKRLRNFCNPQSQQQQQNHSHSQSQPHSIPSQSNQTFILNTILSALHRLPSIEQKSIYIDPKTCEQVEPRVRVFVPRTKLTRSKPSSKDDNNKTNNDSKHGSTPDGDVKRKRNADIMSKEKWNIPNSNQIENMGDPHFVSNVALVLTAAQRKNSTTNEGTTVASSKSKTKMATDSYVQSQVQVANALLSLLKVSLDNIAIITVSSPGFLNFWIRQTNETVNDAEMNMDEAKEHFEEQHGSFPEMPLSASMSTVLSQGRESGKFGEAISNPTIVDLKENPNRISFPGSPRTVHTGKELNGKTTARRKRAHQDALSSGRQVISELHMKNDNSDEGMENEFTMELVPSRFSREVYEVYKKYQMTIHQERSNQCTEDTFRRFLVDSPLVPMRTSDEGDMRYGSFHMMYRISGRLFAVGVVDVLPRCLSSVYLFYDPEYAKLSPGTLSALKEIEWIREKTNALPSLQYYYMGYYIHTCPKMRYKANFMPSEILCDETKRWVHASIAKERLNQTNGRGLRLAPPEEEPAPEAESFMMSDEEVKRLAQDSKIEVILGSDDTRILTLRRLDILCGNITTDLDPIREKLRAFVRLVGKNSAPYFVHIV